MQFSLAHLRSPYSLPYRWILPVLQLLLCLVALWPVRGRINQAFFRDQPQRVVVLSGNTSVEDIEAESSNASDDEKTHLRVPMALDLPALLVQTPYVLLTSARTVPRPGSIPLLEWNAAFLPFAGLVFWWSAGRGLEALLASAKKTIAPRITRLETIGALAMLFIGVVMVVVTFSGAIEENSFMSGSAGFALWAGLSVPLLLAKYAQRKLEKLTQEGGVQQPDVQPGDHYRDHPAQ